MSVDHRLTIPRHLVPAMMLLGRGGPGPRPLAPAVAAQLEQCGALVADRPSPSARQIVACMTEPTTVVSVEVATATEQRLSTVWGTPERAVWGRRADGDRFELTTIDAIEVPLLLAQLTGLDRRGGATSCDPCGSPAASVMAAGDPCTTRVTSSLDRGSVDRSLGARRRVLWTVSSVWCSEAGDHEVRELTVLDTGPAGYWRIEPPHDLDGSSTYARMSHEETLGRLARLVPPCSAASI